MRKKDKQITLTVTSGVPFKSFETRNFFVTKSIIDPQARDDMNCDSAAQAQRAAIAYARQVKGTVIKTTIETVGDFTDRKASATS